MRREREHVPLVMVKRRHRWEAVAKGSSRPDAIEHCDDCGITRALGGWYDRWGELHAGPVPRCGDR